MKQCLVVSTGDLVISVDSERVEQFGAEKDVAAKAMLSVRVAL